MCEVCAAAEEAEFLCSVNAERNTDVRTEMWCLARLGGLADKIVNTMLASALTTHTPDVHLVLRQDLRILYRIDGRLETVCTLSKPLGGVVFGRVKVLAGLPVFESESPAEGGFSFCTAGQNRLDLRASLVPLAVGERLVLRAMNVSGLRSLKELGMRPSHAKLLGELACRPGLTLISGPAGSGKTTTLYAILRLLAARKMHIVTLEEPVEYRSDSFSQLEMNAQRGFTFGSAFKTCLRQDADVVAVGEIRDSASARIAFEAALTGRPVISTVHSEDSAGAFLRLAGLGIDTRLAASVTNCVVAQRIARRACERCYGHGCAACEQTGHKGRTAVFEVMPIVPVIRRALEKQITLSELRRLRKAAGFSSLDEEMAELAREGAIVMPNHRDVFEKESRRHA